MQTEQQPTPVLVFNRSARFYSFPKPSPIAVKEDGTKDLAIEWHRFSPGLTLAESSEVTAAGVDSPKLNPYLGRDIRIIRSWRDLGEGDAIDAIRATGDKRILRAVLDVLEVGEGARAAVRKAAEDRLASIERGNPHANAKMTSYEDEDYDLDSMGLTR